ncbi:hypothetical protein H6775_03290 [Candidatus Nomurabacteria bacterium]|nr:hypothetical protein [Candidatus Nomurabacteria bacterium]
MKKYIEYIILFTAGGGLGFQVVHFWEHLMQVFNWIFVQRQYAYMTGLGMSATNYFGNLFFSGYGMSDQTRLGMEVLHLVGNGIFLIGIIAVWYFIKNREILWALIIEALHFCEHISLTFSSIFTGRSIGFSTLYGLATDPQFMVTFRVWWHFILNLVPSVLIVVGIVLFFRYKKVN